MIALIEFPSIVKKYAPFFEDCFSPEGYEHFKKAISGYMISDNKTLEAINRLFLFNKKNQSSFNRFYNRQNFDINVLNNRRLEMLQKNKNTAFKNQKGQKGVLGIDSSLLKHYGKHFHNIYYHYDYVHKCYRWSHDLVTLHYSDDQTDYPVHYQLWEPPDWDAVATFFIDKGFTINEEKWTQRHEQGQKWRNYIRSRYRTGAKKHPQVKAIYKTKIDLAEDLIAKFCSQYPDLNLPIALDIGFTSAQLCQKIVKDFKRDYVGSLREDQNILQAGNKKKSLKEFVQQLREEHWSNKDRPVFKKSTFTYKGKKEIRYVYTAKHSIQGFNKKQKLVISFLKKDLTDRPVFTITNRADWHPSGILRIRRHRWPVETYHQEGKTQGLEKYQVRNDKAIQTYIAFIVVAFSMLKCTIHDHDLLTKIQQRLQSEMGNTLPFLRRLMRTEALFVLIEHLLCLIEEGKSLQQVFEPISKISAYV